MIPRLFAVPLILVLAAGLLGAGLPPELASAQQEPPPPPGAEAPATRLMYDGLLDVPRLPPAGAAVAPEDAPAQLASGYANWSRLTFQSARNGHDWEVYAARGDGSEQVDLSNHASMDIHPRLNRDATRIAFASNRHGKYEIFAMNADGSGLVRLTNNATDDLYPAWSPDGSRIAFQAYRNNQAEIYVMNADGSGQVRLTNYSDYDGEPAWSPDGTQIAFTRMNAGQYHIWTMDADGSNPRQLSGQPNSEYPAWSPDGTQIAYDAESNGDGWQELWLMDAGGGNQRHLWESSGLWTDAWARSWSPDGRYVAFTVVHWIYEQNQWYWTTAYLYAVEASAPQNLMQLSTGGADWNPDWRSVDLQPPTSGVQPLPAQSAYKFTVQWTGADAGPAGLARIDVQVRDGAAGAWRDWQSSATDGSASYEGIGGHTYYIRARATDNAGNVETWPADYDTFTTVEALAPQTTAAALPPYSHSGAIIRWGGSDPGGSGIESYDVQMREGSGAWTDWLMGTTEEWAALTGAAGQEYAFRVRGRDFAENLEAWPAGGADATTMLYAWSVMGHAADNRGAPAVGLDVTTAPAAIHAAPSDGDGAYRAYVAAQAADYSVNWSKAAYGSLPETRLPSAYDGRVDVVLPPADNVVQNWGFENGSAGWQFAGNLTGTITTTRHSGTAAAFLGSGAQPFRAGTTLAGPEMNRFFNPDAALDAAGVIHGVWTGPEYRVVYSSKPPGKPWTAPLPLPGAVTSWFEWSKILADQNGTLHVVWVAEDGLYYTRNRPGLGWSTPERIPGTVTTREKPELAIGIGGVVKVAWSAGVSEGYRDLFFSQRDPAGVWSSPRDISARYGDDFAITMVTDHSGLAHVVSYGESSGYGHLFYSAETGDGSWLPPVEVSEGVFYHADMVIDVLDTAHVVWSNDSGVFYRMRPAGESWSPIESVSHSYGAGVSLAVDALDRLHLAWGDVTSRQMRYAVRSNGTWSASEDIAPPKSFYDETPPKLVVDVNLRVHVLWKQRDSWDLRYAVRSPDGGWSAPVDFSRHRFDTGEPQLLVDPFGTPHALWRAGVSTMGSNGAAMYAGPGPVEAAGEATLSQVIQVPAAGVAPTLSFLHRFGTEFPSDSRLEVVIDDSISSSVVFSATTGTDAWTHAWADLTPWAGRSVTLRFRVIEAAGGAHAWAFIDEVTVGAAHPDTWVRLSGPRAAAPGGQLVQEITFGNRGGMTAGSGQVTLQLPSELVFVSAEPPPSAAPALRWDVGGLVRQSEPGTIHVTLQVAPSAAYGAMPVTTAAIASDAAEIEQANNTAQAATFIGHQRYLPVIERR